MEKFWKSFWKKGKERGGGGGEGHKKEKTVKCVWVMHIYFGIKSINFQNRFVFWSTLFLKALDPINFFKCAANGP
jgi:hypothetical protein